MIKNVKTRTRTACSPVLISLLVLALALIFTLPLTLTLIGCGSVGSGGEGSVTSGGADNTTAPGEESTALDPFAGIPDTLRYDGYAFNILSYDADTWNVYLDAEAVNGSLLNDAAYARNSEVEKRLGITVGTTLIPHATIAGEIQTANLSGNCEYDLVSFWATTNVATLLTGNQVYDWKDLGYVDLEAEWFNQTANEAFDIAGKQYLAVSDLTYSVQQNFQILCNLNLMTERGLEAPYQTVRDGAWTYEKMMNYVSGVYTDLNNNGIKDDSDFYGLGTSVNAVSRFVNNWGESPVTVGDSGFVINISGERLTDMVGKMNAMLQDAGTYFPPSGNGHYNIFNQGRSLFEFYTSDPALLLEITGFKYGYLPYPKYDENQENYITVTHGGIMAVPIQVRDPERAGVIINVMSAASTKHIEPAFIYNYIESRVLQDADSVDMYRLMRSTAFYDLSRSIDPSTYFSGLKYYTEMLKINDSNLAAQHAKYSRIIEINYGDMYEALTKNN